MLALPAALEPLVELGRAAVVEQRHPPGQGEAPGRALAVRRRRSSRRPGTADRCGSPRSAPSSARSGRRSSPAARRGRRAARPGRAARSAHSSACMPPIDPPTTTAQRSMPSASAKATCASTWSRMVRYGKRVPHSDAVGRERGRAGACPGSRRACSGRRRTSGRCRWPARGRRSRPTSRRSRGRARRRRPGGCRR